MSLPFDPIRVFETAPLIEGYDVIKNAFPTVGKYSKRVITYADAVHEALDELISDYSDWPEDQGFGSSDMTYARQSFINTMIDFANLRGYYETKFDPYLKVVEYSEAEYHEMMLRREQGI